MRVIIVHQHGRGECVLNLTGLSSENSTSTLTVSTDSIDNRPQRQKTSSVRHHDCVLFADTHRIKSRGQMYRSLFATATANRQDRHNTIKCSNSKKCTMQFVNLDKPASTELQQSSHVIACLLNLRFKNPNVTVTSHNKTG